LDCSPCARCEPSLTSVSACSWQQIVQYVDDAAGRNGYTNNDTVCKTYNIGSSAFTFSGGVRTTDADGNNITVCNNFPAQRLQGLLPLNLDAMFPLVRSNSLDPRLTAF